MGAVDLPLAVVGIDPGATTGMVARCGERLLKHDTVRVDAAWIGEGLDLLLGKVSAMWFAAAHQTSNLVVAVESVRPPVPQMGMTSVGGLLLTAAVFGAVVSRWPGAVIVEPGGHGSGPLAAYPEALRPARGQGRGHDQLRHARSAWDISIAAEGMLRVQHAAAAREGGGP